MRLLLEIFWLMLPAGVANMAPVVAARLFPHWDWPIDAGVSLAGVRLFGDHKTVRGLLAGVVAGALVFIGQQLLCARFEPLRAIARLDYATASWWWGAALGLGALLGDLLKSFFKRRFGIAPGQPWFPFDQIDWMLGALLIAWPMAVLDLRLVTVALLLAAIVSLLVKRVGFWLHLDDKPF
ncbi:MAG: CDP-archaeol synthase [Pseudomonadota bacterium]